MSLFQKFSVGTRQGLLVENFSEPLVRESTGLIAVALKVIASLPDQPSPLGEQVQEFLIRCRLILVEIGSAKFARRFDGPTFQKYISSELFGPSLNAWAVVYGFDTIKPSLLAQILKIGQAYTDAWYGKNLISVKRLHVMLPNVDKKLVKKNQQELTKHCLESDLVTVLSALPFSKTIRTSILHVITGQKKYLAFLEIMMADISRLTEKHPNMREVMLHLCLCLSGIISHFEQEDDPLHFFNTTFQSILEKTWEGYRVMFKHDHPTPTDALGYYQAKATAKSKSFVSLFQPEEAMMAMPITPQLLSLKLDGQCGGGAREAVSTDKQESKSCDTEKVVP